MSFRRLFLESAKILALTLGHLRNVCQNFGMSSKKEGSESAQDLSRRERQIMDALYRLGSASASEIRDAIPSPPTNTAVRTLLTILHDKGHVRFRQEGARYIYEPVVSREEMGKSMMSGVVQTFFEGSIERVVATLIDAQESKLTNDQIAKLQAIIDEAKDNGR